MPRRIAQKLCHLPPSNILSLIRNLATGRIESLRHARQETILWALNHTKGNVAVAADMLGISRSTVYRCARTCSADAP